MKINLLSMRGPFISLVSRNLKGTQFNEMKKLYGALWQFSLPSPSVSGALCPNVFGLKLPSHIRSTLKNCLQTQLQSQARGLYLTNHERFRAHSVLVYCFSRISASNSLALACLAAWRRRILSRTRFLRKNFVFNLWSISVYADVHTCCPSL